MESVRGMGVALIIIWCACVPLEASARRCSTPKRCCSSTIASPSLANFTSSWNSAWVPMASCVSPETIASTAFFFSRALRLPASHAILTPRGSSQCVSLR